VLFIHAYHGTENYYIPCLSLFRSEYEDLRVAEQQEYEDLNIANA
jgi:hypothetical protein